MKHLILPIFKIIAAILLTLVCVIIYTVAPLLYWIWTCKRLPYDFFEVNFLQSGNGVWWSPFIFEDDCEYKHWYVFKTVFHFIWGLPPKEIFKNNKIDFKICN